MKRALISVYNKENLIPFARFLYGRQYEIISSGGTKSYLNRHGVRAQGVENITKMPEMMDGRVKTLHPRIHGGILMRRGVDDKIAAEHGIAGIDMVIVNLYPFEDVVSDKTHRFADAIENIDVGGPAMVRAAAKNHSHVTVLTSPEQYEIVIREIEGYGEVRSHLRLELAQKAFAATSRYDRAIALYLSDIPNNEPTFA